MATFKKEELGAIASLSALQLDEKELTLYTEQIQQILQYVEQLNQVSLTQQVEFTKNINIFRDDVAVKQDPTDILGQAPEVDEGYFTVPKILEEK